MTPQESIQKFTEQPSLERVPAAILFLLQKVERLEQLLEGRPASVKKYIGSVEACKITDLSKPTLYKLTATGDIPCYKGSDGKGKLMFIREELEAWQDAQAKKKPSMSLIRESEKSAYNAEQERLAEQLLKGGRK